MLIEEETFRQVEHKDLLARSHRSVSRRVLTRMCDAVHEPLVKKRRKRDIRDSSAEATA